MPCNPGDLTFTEPDGPRGPSLPGFGDPFAPELPDLHALIPDGFPEDLLEILDLLQFILPSGVMKPSLSLNFGKDIFDGIMSLLDKFMPFLMVYKFFLPILELIICIIEVLCAIANPFKLIRALKRLFRTCLPNFLSLFPIFALIMMIISLLLLILALIEYIIGQIIKMILIILKNIRTIVKAIIKHDGPSVLKALKKLGLLLCGFQNLFALFGILKIIIDIIKDMLKLVFAIPPCDDGDSTDQDKCCTTDVCPDFIRNNEELVRTTGTFKYLNQVSVSSGLSLPALFTSLNFDLRSESWQFYDSQAALAEAIYNITDAYDLPEGVEQVFFPTDATYNASTPIKQAPYTVDLKLYYDPVGCGAMGEGVARYVYFNDCIVTFAPTTNLSLFDNSTATIANGVIKLAGGVGREANGSQLVIDGNNATLENFIHYSAVVSTNPTLDISDGYVFNDIEYTFKIKHEVLLQKALITLGCIPTVALDRTFINTAFGGNASLNLALLDALVNGSGSTFPDIAAAQECLTTAITNLRNNISEAGVAAFQAQTTVCLNKLKDDTGSALGSLVGIGFDASASAFTTDLEIQFTSKPIVVSVALKERNGQPLVSKFPAELAADIANRITPTISFGEIGPFQYDGVEFFTANLTSAKSGAGTVKVMFDNQQLTTINNPEDVSELPSITEQVLNYAFIFSAASEVDGKPKRDEGDISREGE